MSARESQLLLEEIERKQQRLDDLSSEPPLWVEPPRPNRWYLVAAVITVLALVAMICGLVLLDKSCMQAGQRTASDLRVQLKNAPNIPWRHYLGHDGPRSCDVFLSVLGIAEVECDGKTVYRGFGSIDYDGSFHSLALDEATRFDHDVTRAAYIDVRRRHAHIAALSISGRLATAIVDITGLQDQSLVEAPLPEAPSIDMQAAITRVLRAHVRDLNRCDSFRGGLSLLVSVDVSGKVADVTIHDSTLPQSVDRCLTKVVRKWTFPALPTVYQTDIPVVFAD